MLPLVGGALHGLATTSSHELLTDNGDGTYSLAVTLAGDPLLDLVDVQHLLFTGSGYAVDEIYFEEEVWVDGPGDVEVKVPVWENKGTIGATSWGSEYRFASEEGKTGEECYAFPMDVWERMKTETFYAMVMAPTHWLLHSQAILC